MQEETGMNFLEHVQELRKRIIYSLIPILLFFIPCYIFSKQLFSLLMNPIIKSLPEGSSLIFTRPAEGFLTYLKVSLFFSFFLSFPFILYNAWHFVSPALYKNEKKVVIPLVVFGTLFFILGALFCYFLAAPKGLAFLLGEYTTHYVKAFPSIQEALSFLTALMIGFGLVFEFPLVIFILSRLGLVTAGFLSRQRKYALLINAVLAAFITPTTDAVSMMFMLVPLFIFYEIGIIIAKIFAKKKPEAESTGEEFR